MDNLGRFTVLRELAEKFSSDYKDEIIFELNNKSDCGIWYQKIHQLGIPSRLEGTTKIAVDIRRLSGFFYDRDDFRLRAGLNLKYFEDNIYILKDTLNTKLSLTPIEAIQPIIGTNGEIDYFYLNIYYYSQIYEEYKKLHIYSYHNDAHREFVLLSPNKKEFFLGYTRTTPDFCKIDLSKKYELISSISKTKEYLAFFKEQTISRLEAFENVEMRFVEFIKNIEQIASAANTDFEVFLKKFDFEKFKQDFRKERDEYFSRLQNILGNLFNKVASVPVSISAAALALYNVSDDLLPSTLIILGSVTLSFFTSWLIRGLHEDTILIEKDFLFEIDVLEEASIQSLNQTINNEFDKVSKKISQIYRYIITLQLLLASSSVIALWVYFYKILSYNNCYIGLITISVVGLQFLLCFLKLKRGKTTHRKKK